MLTLIFISSFSLLSRLTKCVDHHPGHEETVEAEDDAKYDQGVGEQNNDHSYITSINWSDMNENIYRWNCKTTVQHDSQNCYQEPTSKKYFPDSCEA